MQKITINNDISGNLLKCITDKQPQLNYNMLYKALRKKDIRVNGVKTSDNLNLVGGESIEIFLPEAKQKVVPVVYEDDNILVVNKPARMEVTKKDAVFDKSACLEDFFEGYKAVHRLDKNTEGLVILAKTEKVEKEFVLGFKNNAIKKHYLALVWGVPSMQSGNLSDYLVKGDKQVRVFKNKVDNGEKIKTNYKMVKSNGNTSLLDVELLTGKTHQIRAHLAFYGMFIVGDDKYGDYKLNKENKVFIQCLCAYWLSFDFAGNSFLSYLNKKTFEIKPSFGLI